MREVHYYSNYYSTRDIDCFFKIGSKAYHFASNGHPIPSFIKRKNNIKIQEIVYGLSPNTNQVTIFCETIKELINRNLERLGLLNDNLFNDSRNIENEIEEYASSFKEMAQIGFISLDLTDNGNYYIIAKPNSSQLPKEIIELLPEVDKESINIIESEENQG